MRAVCDRFAKDLAFVMVNDDIAHNAGLMINPTMPRKGSKNARWRLIINLDEKMLGELE
jgi:predicted transcriptional regulator of viral defense system